MGQVKPMFFVVCFGHILVPGDDRSTADEKANGEILENALQMLGFPYLS